MKYTLLMLLVLGAACADAVAPSSACPSLQAPANAVTRRTLTPDTMTLAAPSCLMALPQPRPRLPVP